MIDVLVQNESNSYDHVGELFDNTILRSFLMKKLFIALCVLVGVSSLMAMYEVRTKIYEGEAHGKRVTLYDDGVGTVEYQTKDAVTIKQDPRNPIIWFNAYAMVVVEVKNREITLFEADPTRPTRLPGE